MAQYKHTPSKNFGTQKIYKRPNNGDNCDGQKRGTSYDKNTPPAGIIDKRNTGNDPAWYTMNGQLAKDVGTLFFSQSLTPGTLKVGGKNIITPGVMVAEVLPTYGMADSNSSALNVAAASIYSYIRHENSGHANYDSPDLMLYLMAMDNIYMAWINYVRAYGIARAYNYQNRYYPNRILDSMGFSSNDILRNMSAMRANINALSRKMSSLAVPAIMPLFKRHLWLFKNVFLDRSVGKAQTVLLRPAGFYEYNELQGAGKLDFRYYNTDYDGAADTSYTVDGYYNIVNEMIDKVWKSEDCRIMSGDILKAYGANNLITMAEIGEDYTVIPAYDETFTMQFHNAEALGCGQKFYPSITQSADVSRIVATVVAKITDPKFDNKHLINIGHDQVSVDDVFESTRFMFSCGIATDANTDGTKDVTVLNCGSEIITNYVVPYEIAGINHAFKLGTYVPETSDLDKVALLTAFDWHPRVFVGNGIMIGDLDNYTVEDMGTLDRINDVAIMSEFNIPYTLIGK